MDPILERFEQLEFHYGPSDPKALAILEDRIAEAGRSRKKVLTYSELVEAVTFQIGGGKTRQIDTSNWHDFDRAIVGSFLGYISKRSYKKGKFFASALVIGAISNRPGDGFNQLLVDVGLIASKTSLKVDELWMEHLNKACAWYAKNPPQ